MQIYIPNNFFYFLMSWGVAMAYTSHFLPSSLAAAQHGTKGAHKFAILITFPASQKEATWIVSRISYVYMLDLKGLYMPKTTTQETSF
jgi:hypothetical protein